MEFDFIARHFANIGLKKGVLCDIGDDCALLNAPQKLAISTDTLVCGTHFLENDPPFDLGWKSLAVNLSDLAAMGAQPLWALLALSIPEYNVQWEEKIHQFAQGLNACAQQYHIALVGGDTTRGPWSITLTVLGHAENPMLRSAALENDDIWLSRETGWAALGLDLKLKSQTAAHSLPLALQQRAQKALSLPQPELALSSALSGIVQCAIDVSDGLWGDLAHIAQQSQLSAHLFLEQFPPTLRHALMADQPYCLEKMLAGGEDYALLFSASAQKRAQIEAIGNTLHSPLWRIGYFAPRTTLPIFCWDQNHQEIGQTLNLQAFEHF